MLRINEYIQQVEIAVYIKKLHSQMSDHSDAGAIIKTYTNEYGILFQND